MGGEPGMWGARQRSIRRLFFRYVNRLVVMQKPFSNFPSFPSLLLENSMVNRLTMQNSRSCLV